MKRILLLFLLMPGCFLIDAQTEIDNFQIKKKSEQSYNSGIHYINSGNYAEALKSFSESIKNNPQSDKAYLQRAKAKYELKDAKGALDDLKKSLELNKNNGEASFCLGLYELFTDTATANIQNFDNALLNGFNKPQTYYYRAVLKKYKNDLIGALSDFSMAIDKNPKYAAAYFDRGICKIEKTEFKSAIEDLKQAVLLDTSLIDAYTNIANAQLLKGDYDEAIVSADKVLNRKQDCKALVNKGAAYFFKENYDLAEKNFASAIQINAKYDKAQVGLANTLLKQNKASEAIEHYSKAILQNPKNAEAYLNRGTAKENTGDLDGACSDWKNAANLGNKLAQSFITECN